MDVFVSYSYQDATFCRRLTQALREAGARVWLHDGYSNKAGQQILSIQHAITVCPVFLLLFSTSALTSQEVYNEGLWAYSLYRRDMRKQIIPVMLEYMQEMQVWPFIREMKRIELAPFVPYSYEEAIRHTVQLVMPPVEQGPLTPFPANTPPSDMLENGKTLLTQRRYTEALPILERLTQLAPYLPTAWYFQGIVFDKLEQYEQAVAAYDRAVNLDPDMISAWVRKGNSCFRLERFEEALSAYDQAITFGPLLAHAWIRKGFLFENMERFQEALDAYEQALLLTPAAASANIWFNKGLVLQKLRRFEDALDAYKTVLTLEPDDTDAAQRVAALEARQSPSPRPRGNQRVPR